MTFAVDMGSNIHSNCSLELLTLNSYKHIFSFVERNLCVAIHKYMGEFVYEIERSAQLIPGRCPIPKGVHRIHNVPLNFDRISLQTFPFGKLRFTERAYDKQNRMVLCLIIELDNRE
ncbi:hypothetical protein ILUMI_06745 [Ignelater luminosus]|uniref:Uncharacterized protein n=1 Tax=Ignelater luminosus TaxID=2038154 RepID=A0A8K0D9N3_IGNLU|nr:hypothetical protein ILUMI_06745 [Ignelater luminosus]